MAHGIQQWQSRTEFEDKALQEGDDFWRLSGYAATYQRDKINDIIVPGAFAKCLARIKSGAQDSLQLYFNHDIKAPPIGAVEVVEERKKGLYYEATLPKDDEFVAKRIVPQIKRRSLKSNSFGYKPVLTEKQGRDRLLKEIDIHEISVVGFPCGNGADIEGIKGFIPFGDHFVDRNITEWDADATLKKLLEKFGDKPDDLKQFFLWVDEEKEPQQWDAKLLIADIDENNRVSTNRIALFKSVAYVAGAREGVELPEVAESAVKEVLERYYRKLDLDAPFKSLSADEYETLSSGELESRLRGIGVSRKLATRITGQRDADRKQAQRDAGSKEDASSALLEALAKFVNGAAAITS